MVDLDQKKYAITIKSQHSSLLVIERPSHEQKTFYTYIKNDASRNGRFRLKLIPYSRTTQNLLFARTGNNIERKRIKKLHRFTHASDRKMHQFLKDASIANGFTEAL